MFDLCEKTTDLTSNFVIAAGYNRAVVAFFHAFPFHHPAWQFLYCRCGIILLFMRYHRNIASFKGKAKITFILTIPIIMIEKITARLLSCTHWVKQHTFIVVRCALLFLVLMIHFTLIKYPFWDEVLDTLLILSMFFLFMVWNKRLVDEIQARALAEKTLRDSESKLRAILNTEAECVKVTDAEGCLLQMNQAGLIMLEAEDNPSAILGKPVELLLVEEYRADFRQMNARVLQGFAQTLCYQIDGLKGTRRWVETQAVPLFDNETKSTHILAVTRDISERKQIEQREKSRNYVLELLTTNVPLNQILESIIRILEQDHPTMLGCVMLVDAKGNRIVNQMSLSLPHAFVAYFKNSFIPVTETTVFSHQRTLIADIQTHPDWKKYRVIAMKAKLVSYWGEPIKDSQGKLLGIFAIYHQHKLEAHDNDLGLLQQTAALCGIAIERSRFNEEQKLAQLVYQNSSEAITVTDAHGKIMTVNPAFTKLTGYSLDEVVGQSTRILGSGRQSKNFYKAMWQSINTTGGWQGEILNRRKNGEVYTEWLTINTIFNADGSVDRRVALFSDITHKKESESLIWKQAHFDSLTELPNRQMFQEQLRQEIKKSSRAGLPLALLIIDLDRFKEVNETLGHEIGDMLLKQAAQRLCDCVRETDVVARLGGDEFTVILGSLHNLAPIDVIAQTILQHFLQPFYLHDDRVYISASIGIALYPDDAEEVGDLLKSADQAMYTAKNQGRNRYSYYASFMQEAAKIRMRIATDLRNALIENQFCLLYQPIVELHTGKVRKAEALIRWQHPEHGLISPISFIPIAEETDMIVKIGNWVFLQATAQAKQWREKYDAQFQISINKSPVQFQAPQNDHNEWLRHLEKIGLSGQGIVIEITEGLLMETSETIIERLLKFRAAGIQISLDDFGTGYSSLSYLKKFNIDYLKIDQSFVRNMEANSNDLALCEAIIVMAHKLDIKVIAEGIETIEQRDLLQQAGCDYGQGYLFSQPLTAVEFEKFFTKTPEIATIS